MGARASLAYGVLLLVLLGLPACHCPRPGFVGIPEAVERSPDLSLPLSAEDQTALIGFLVSGGTRPPRGWSIDDEDPGLVQKIRDEYGELLRKLSRSAPTKEELRAGTGALAQLFDDPHWVLSVHDARVGEENGDFYDLDSERVRALVKGDSVFAFYSRRLKPLIITQDQVPGLSSKTGTVWVLEDEISGVYSGLLVFHKTFAVPTKAN